MRRCRGEAKEKLSCECSVSLKTFSFKELMAMRYQGNEKDKFRFSDHLLVVTAFFIRIISYYPHNHHVKHGGIPFFPYFSNEQIGSEMISDQAYYNYSWDLNQCSLILARLFPITS